MFPKRRPPTHNYNHLQQNSSICPPRHSSLLPNSSISIYQSKSRVSTEEKENEMVKESRDPFPDKKTFEEELEKIR